VQQTWGQQNVIGIEADHVIPMKGDDVLVVSKETNFVIVRLRRCSNVNPKRVVGL
jgi:hypothetical protein